MAAVASADIATAAGLADSRAVDLLKALRMAPQLDPEARLGLLEELNTAQDEIDALRRKGTLGLTVQLNDVVIRQAHDTFLAGKSGEIYLVSWILTGNGKAAEFRSKEFVGIKSGDPLPLGEGGLLLGLVRDPRWFVDLHAVVMESDSDVRGIGDAIELAKKESGWDQLLTTLGTMGGFDPSKISQAMNVIGLFADLVVHFLKANHDDHVATIHDFYLEKQGFGHGRHPRKGAQTFQDVEARYTVELSVVS